MQAREEDLREELRKPIKESLVGLSKKQRMHDVGAVAPRRSLRFSTHNNVPAST